VQPYLQRIWLIVALVVCSGVGTAVWALRLPPVYQARSTISVTRQQQRVISIEGMGQDSRMDDTVMLNTIVQSVRNTSVLRRVVSTNNLTGDERLTGERGRTISEESAMARVSGMLTVRLRPGTLLIDIVADSTNSTLTALVANSAAREYIADRAERVFLSTQNGSESLRSEVNSLEKKLRASEKKLQQFREDHQMTSIEGERSLLSQQLVKLIAEADAYHNELQTLQTDLDQAAKSKEKLQELMAIKSIATMPSVVGLSQQILQQQVLLAGYTNRYKPKHPKFIQAVQQLGDLQKSQTSVIYDSLAVLEKRVPVVAASEKATREEINKLQDRIQALNRISSDYAALERDVATDTALQQSVLKRIKELDLTKQIDNVPITISEIAPEPRGPSGPNRVRFILQGAAAGLVLALGLVYMLQSIDGSIRTVDEAEDRLQLPVLGAISIDAGSQGQTLPRLVMIDEAHGLTAEGFRSLRASTAMIGRAEDIKVRLVTSALPSEGKSFCTLNYAAALAQLGQRVVLVDLDLRRPTVGKRLQMNPDDPGVSSFLLGQKSFLEIQHKTRVEGLIVIPAGPRIPNPAEQLAGPHTKELFQALTDAFDVVVVDTAPINSVADTISLLPFAKIVLLVIKAAKTPERAIFRAISEMRRVGAQIDGLVLNQLPKRGGYGYYYYYYGRDGYGSAGVYGAPDNKGKS
jgi:capsular exopolysaccharide synthesis family protein